MTIPLKKEPDEMYENTRIFEKCYFCYRATRFWHIKSNNPVCPVCATLHKVCELPNWLRIKK